MKRGRPVTTASLEDKIASLDEKMRNEDEPLSRVELIQTRIDAQRHPKVIGEVNSTDYHLVATSHPHNPTTNR